MEPLIIPPLHPTRQGYRIFFEKSIEDSFLGLPEDKKPELTLLYKKVHTDPKRALPILLDFQAQFPSVFEVPNLLTLAYLKLKKKKKAETLIAKIYEQFPDRLLAKINYADQCLRFEKIEMIPQIFQNHFDLNTLFPDRFDYDYPEFRAFMLVMGFYFLEIGDRTRAENYYHIAFQVDPLHPGVHLLEKKLYRSHSPLLRFFQFFKLRLSSGKLQ